MFAIVEIAGKQYKVEKGDLLRLEKLKETKPGDKVKIDKVLLKAEGDKADIGNPYLKGSSVELLIKAEGKGEKIRVYKKKAKKRWERTYGHRQQYTEAEVVGVK